MLSTIVFWVSVFFVNIDFGWPCSCDKLGSCDCRTSNLSFVGITVDWELLFCFMFSFFSQYASCVSVSSSFILSWLLYFLFLLTRFGGGLSFRVFCAAGLMLLLLSLVVFWFCIFLLTPCFVGFMAGSASLISISFSFSSIFLFLLLPRVIGALFYTVLLDTVILRWDLVVVYLQQYIQLIDMYLIFL